MPEVFEQAQVVGKWVWLEFNVAPVRPIRDKLKELGFHWNAGRKCWQKDRSLGPRHHRDLCARLGKKGVWLRLAGLRLLRFFAANSFPSRPSFYQKGHAPLAEQGKYGREHCPAPSHFCPVPPGFGPGTRPELPVPG
jgi:hypothetical protein